VPEQSSTELALDSSGITRRRPVPNSTVTWLRSKARRRIVGGVGPEGRQQARSEGASGASRVRVGRACAHGIRRRTQWATRSSRVLSRRRDRPLSTIQVVRIPSRVRGWMLWGGSRVRCRAAVTLSYPTSRRSHRGPRSVRPGRGTDHQDIGVVADFVMGYAFWPRRSQDLGESERFCYILPDIVDALSAMPLIGCGEGVRPCTKLF